MRLRRHLRGRCGGGANHAHGQTGAAPPNYDPAQYELLARYLEALVAAGKKPKLAEFWNPIWMPNGKTDINNNGGFSTDFIGMNYDSQSAATVAGLAIDDRAQKLDYAKLRQRLLADQQILEWKR